MTTPQQHVEVLKHIASETRKLAAVAADYGISGMQGKARIDAIASQVDAAIAALQAQASAPPEQAGMVQCTFCRRWSNLSSSRMLQEVPAEQASAPGEAGAVDFERAAVLLERYAEVIRQAPHTEIERYDYLPEVEDMATLIRRLAAVAPAGMDGRLHRLLQDHRDYLVNKAMLFPEGSEMVRQIDEMVALATPPATAGQEDKP